MERCCIIFCKEATWSILGLSFQCLDFWVAFSMPKWTELVRVEQDSLYQLSSPQTKKDWFSLDFAHWHGFNVRGLLLDKQDKHDNNTNTSSNNLIKKTSCHIMPFLLNDFSLLQNSVVSHSIEEVAGTGLVFVSSSASHRNRAWGIAVVSAVDCQHRWHKAGATWYISQFGAALNSNVSKR